MVENKIIASYFIQTAYDPVTAVKGLCAEQSVSHLKSAKKKTKLQEKSSAKIIDLDIIKTVKKPFLKTFVNFNKLQHNNYFNIKARIAFPIQNFDASITNMLNAVAGESHHLGYFSALKLTELQFPEKWLKLFKGPAFGIDGIRKKLNVYNRPLICGPVKPSVGLTIKEFAQKAFDAFAGGVDIIKDDELLANLKISPLKDRVIKMKSIVKKAEDVTGEKKMYIANVTDDQPKIIKNVELALKCGADGIMLCPMLCGISNIIEIRNNFDVPIFAHNSFATTFTRVPWYGIRYSVIIDILRICGADVIIFPSAYGTFTTDKDETMDNTIHCRKKLYNITRALPALAGGKFPLHVFKYWNLFKSCEFMIISGAAIYDHPQGTYSGALSFRQACEAYISNIKLADYAKNHKELISSHKQYKKQYISNEMVV